MRLLSLDGGAIRGLSSLYLLEDVMLKLKYVAGLDRVPAPHEYFDMICGTSTGGVIAIMLGRLEMTVEECIDAYLELGKVVFKDENPYYKRTKYDSKILERCIAKIVKEKTGSETTSFLDDNKTKVFMTSYEERAMGWHPILLKSYSSQTRTVKCSIVEAAMVTSAAPTFFSPKPIGNQVYIHGGLGCNDPTMEIIYECEDLLRLTRSLIRHPTVVLSIGTGSINLIELEKAGKASWWKDRSGLNCAETLSKIVASCDQVHHDVGRRFAELDQAERYFRLNVDRGLENVILDECEKDGDILYATTKYLQGINSLRLPEKCSELLVAEQISRPEVEETDATANQDNSNQRQPRILAFNYAGNNINQINSMRDFHSH